MDALSDPLGYLEESVGWLAGLGFPPPLVVVDTLGALMGGDIEDAGSSAAWTPIMPRLTGIARTTGAAVVLLHHSRKSDGQYRDSTAIGANVDMILTMSGGKGAERTITCKGRWRADDHVVELREDSFRLLAGGKPIEEYAIDYVAANPGCSMRLVRDGVPARNEKVDAAVGRLLKAGRIENRGTAAAFKLHVVDTLVCPDAKPM